MTAIKLCGLTCVSDIKVANELKPEYIGFVFAKKSKRYLTPKKAAEQRKLLMNGIRAVGVFVNEAPETVAELLDSDVIDLAQLHGSEDAGYIRRLKALTQKPLIQAFQIKSGQDLAAAEQSAADYVLLDSGAGTGVSFDWRLIQNFKRPYFLAGGLSAGNVGDAVRYLNPYAVDVSSGIETEGRKEKGKMAAFVAAVRKEGKR